jgi:DNA processing protein
MATATATELSSYDRLPAEAYAAALASLPAMGPARLLALLRQWSAEKAWAEVRRGVRLPLRGADAASVASLWQRAASTCDVAAVWRGYVDAGIGVAALGSAAYPAPIGSDIEPPGVVFFSGDPAVICGPRVAIVGTRRCTRYGIDVAFELGRDLAAAGVAVVSGLAVGIDASAHAGALHSTTTPPIAVVGSGLDVIYPRRNAVLWREVERRGVVLSEAPLGARPEKWRFPARNRLIAALADAVVVVESGTKGGSLHTVTEAMRRDRAVYAVPGPVRSDASAGTNRLLADGAAPACDAGDILLGLGMSPALRRPVGDDRLAPCPADAELLEAMGWQPASLEQLALRTALDLGAIAVSLANLETTGWVTSRGGWYERIARAEP